MAPCGDPSAAGWTIASPSRGDANPSGGYPGDLSPHVRSADAALGRISRAKRGPNRIRDEDVFDCFERIHRAAELLADGVDQGREEDAHSDVELYSHSRSKDQKQDELDLAAMIDVSQDILRTLRYVQDTNSYNREQQQQQRTKDSEKDGAEPISPRLGIARGQKRKQEQEQREHQHQQQGPRLSHEKQAAPARPTNCHHCNRTVTVQWRSGPDGLKTLCNVCGLLYAKRLKRFQML